MDVGEGDQLPSYQSVVDAGHELVVIGHSQDCNYCIISDFCLATGLLLYGRNWEVDMKLSLIPATLLTGALMLLAPSATFAQHRGGGGGGGHASGGHGSSGGGRSFSAPRGGGGGGGRSFGGRGYSGGERGRSYRGGDHDRDRGYRGYYRGGYRGGYGYRGGTYFGGYYSAPYYYGGSYYAPYDSCGYYDAYGNWIPDPACYADPYYPY
jgi:hypothetical protein